MPACEHFGLGLLPFFPLDSGLLSGKYRRGEKPAGGHPAVRCAATSAGSTARTGTPSRRSTAYGAERGHSLLDVAIAGLAARPAVTSVIAGATTPEQVRANAAAGEWALSAEDVAALDAILND